MDNNKNNNKNASHLTHEMKKEHGGLAEAGMKALVAPKLHELIGIREKQLEMEEEKAKRNLEFFEEEKKLMKKEFQLEKEILEIYYNNGYLPQKNKHEIKYDDTIDTKPEDEKD
ncbi:hypothetical protein MMN27_03190 [Helicobacter pylori]|uniref:hypothetical protein n=1 Tax=Helicobacter pylori TaxID=210 RepID=UPI0030BE37E9